MADSFIPDSADSFVPEQPTSPPRQRPLPTATTLLQMQGANVGPAGAIMRLMLGSTPDEARSRLSALPWLAGIASLPAAAALGPAGFATVPPLAGMLGRAAQSHLGGEGPPTAGEMARSAADVGAVIGLPELVAGAPAMIGGRALRSAAETAKRRGEEGAARAAANIEGRAEVAPAIKAASAEAKVARAAAGQQVGDVVRAASETAPPVTSLEVARNIAEQRAALKPGSPVNEKTIPGIQRMVERQWRKLAAPLRGTLTIEGGAVVGPPGLRAAPIAPGIGTYLPPRPPSRTPMSMPLEDAHIMHRLLDKKGKQAISNSAKGVSTIGDQLLEVASATRKAINERGGEELAAANKAFQQAARTDRRLRSAAERIPTPQEIELRKQASMEAQRRMAQVPTQEPLITWHGGNPIMGKVPFPRPSGANAVARMMLNPKTQAGADALANLLRLLGAPLTAHPSYPPPDTLSNRR